MPRKIFPSKEYQLIDSLRKYLNFKSSSRFPLDIGDDASVRVCEAGERLVLTADAAVEGVHFSLEYITLDEAGFRIMAANLSDCAAMGAVPDSALVQIIFPKSKQIETRMGQLYRGLQKAARGWKFPIVGGNLSAGPCWMIDIMLVGRVPPGAHFLRRRGARSGDFLWVTGSPGESRAGFEALRAWGRRKVPAEFRRLVQRHIAPLPQIDAGLRLAKLRTVHAAMDTSDGLSKDGATLSFENNLVMELDTRNFRCSPSMVSLGQRLGQDCRQWFLHGGEDYGLLFAASPNFVPSCLGGRLRTVFTRIGRFCERGSGVFLVENGKRSQLRPGGWDHLL